MPFILLSVLLALTLHACRRIVFWQRMGMPRAARRRYWWAAWGLGGLILAAMGTQELILLRAGLLTWQTGLPLHLCSLMGVLALPALLLRRPMLLNAALFAGVPGALLALLFPAVLNTPWPGLTSLAFHTLHAGLVCVPLLPMALGWRPDARGAAGAWVFLLGAAAAAGLANRLTGGNYLFLAGPVAGTPLMLLARWGGTAYRLLLIALATLVLAGEAWALGALRKRLHRR